MLTAILMAAAMTVPWAQQEQSNDLPDVHVQGRIPEELAREFIDQVAAPPPGATVARWRDSVCIGTVNLRPETAQYLIDRVASVASDVGLEPEAPGCRPDVVVIATADGQAVARGLADRRRVTLAPGNRIQSRSRGQLDAFAEGDRPVRWWHVSTAVDPTFGRNLVRDPGTDNINYTKTSYLVEDGPVIMGTGPTLIQTALQQDLRRAVIIIDFAELGDDVDFDQLADYVAFIALAQTDPEASTTGFPTILNLFEDPATPGLTDWDRAYLRGLYTSDHAARGDSAREAAIRREMLRVSDQRR
ncbi:hypothetical protein [Brevundimonas sp.]